MDRVFEQITAWLLRSVATAMLLSGMVLVAAAGAAFGMVFESDVLQSIRTAVLQLGAAFVIGGLAAKFLSRGLVLPGEGIPASADRLAGLPRWLRACAATLVAAPVWLVIQLVPFLTEWRRVVQLLRTEGLWDSANANMSGVVLLPLAAALTPPLIELLTVAAFVGSSALLLLLLRSPRLPRFYLVCTVLLAAAVCGSWRGAEAAMLAGDALRELAATTTVNEEEAALVIGTLDRYTSLVSTTVPLLAATFVAYLIWVVPLLASSQTRQTSARDAEPVAAGTNQVARVEDITRPPRFPGMTF